MDLPEVILVQHSRSWLRGCVTLALAKQIARVCFEFALRSAAELLNEIQQLGRDGAAFFFALGRGTSLDRFGVIDGGSSKFSLNELQIAPTHSSDLGWPASILEADLVDRVHGISWIKGLHERLDVLLGWDGVDAGWAMATVSPPGEFGQPDGIELLFTDVLKVHGPVEESTLDVFEVSGVCSMGDGLARIGCRPCSSQSPVDLFEVTASKLLHQDVSMLKVDLLGDSLGVSKSLFRSSF